MDRFEAYTLGDKKVVYIDLGNIKSNEECADWIEVLQAKIQCYPLKSIYTITNIDGTIFDSGSKQLCLDYVAGNAPHVIGGAVIGRDSVSKLMLRALLKASKRDLRLFRSRAEAEKWLESLPTEV